MDIACVRCGNYQISAIGVSELQKITLEQRANLSGWIRENQGCRILGNDLPSLKKLRTPTVGEKANKILLHMAKSSARPGARFSIASTIGTEVFDEGFSIHLSSIELTSVAWATNDQEVFYLLQDYLCTETGYIKSDHGFVITPKGWAYLDSLNRTNTNSTVAFIAMWFDKQVDGAHLAIEAGIRSSGYEPLRIDRKEHNNKIDDEIVAGIRRSKFLVADFTGHRGGVYFEAGLATGLGLPVIWLCRKDELEKTHFDARQYNFIVWEADQLSELSKNLQNRIEATIGHGPL